MPQANGRVLKLVAQLLSFLPSSYGYRIIFMERSINEVLASQDTMLARNERKGAALSPDKLRAVYEDQIRSVKNILRERQLPVLYVNHREVIENPTAQVLRIKTFLEIPLDYKAMEAAVDPSLHRHKKAK
jgi:hypothetical protein